MTLPLSMRWLLVQRTPHKHSCRRFTQIPGTVRRTRVEVLPQVGQVIRINLLWARWWWADLLHSTPLRRRWLLARVATPVRWPAETKKS